MNRTVRQTARLRGSLRLPGDKSLAHRALILGALCEHPISIRGLPRGEDVAATRRCLEALGAVFDDLGDGGLRVHPPRTWSRGLRLDCGNSGTTARLLAGVLAGLGVPATLDGDDSLRRRPMRRVAEPLGALGARVTVGPGGGLPLRIDDPGRPLSGGCVRLDVPSAQVKSAVLLAGLTASAPVTVREPLPSRDHTERMLAAFGAELRFEESSVTLVPDASRLRGRDLRLPADLSTAAFFLVAGALVPDAAITLSGVGVNPTRTGALEVMRAAGVEVVESNRRDCAGEPLADLAVESTRPRAFELGGALVPRLIDEIPVLAVLATQARGSSVVRDAEELRHKESDRIASTVRELRRLGADLREHRDGFEVRGPTSLRGAVVSAWDDHRLAMALGVAGLIAEGATCIEGSERAAVSHPGFWDDLAHLGGGGTVREEPVG